MENSKWADKFTPEEVQLALKRVILKEAVGLDEVYPEFIKHFGPKTIVWFSHFFSDVLYTEKLPILFKHTKILAVLKPGKPKNDVNSYRPISLLSMVSMINSQSEKLTVLTTKLNDLTSKLKSLSTDHNSLKLRVSATEDKGIKTSSNNISSTNALLSEMLDRQHRQKNILLFNLMESNSTSNEQNDDLS
ncbi:Hypothetical protein CINCED_3A023755 [Cinara cedri]|uniref:Reverse transcriptase domain n=1 Tax=Cinara cedri TaxID=506608 RepID=A0A5E4N277_9HEMI|nr:Hypothetical protein CINCED_3A023755 [Cinara cedri]